MKRLSFVAVILIFCFVSVSAQPCLPEGIVFETQAQIDSFQINHPNCTEIEGYVSIFGVSIANLNGLNVLSTIGDGLSIVGSPNLINLMGLENLTSIGGDLWIGIDDVVLGNLSLSSLEGLNSLTTIGGDFHMYHNPMLATVSALSNLTSIGGRLYIMDNNNLQNLAGLWNVSHIGKEIAITDNDELYSIYSGFENLNIITESVWIAYNDKLQFIGLNELDSIGGNLEICNNNALETFYLQNLSFIGGNLVIRNNDNLRDFDTEVLTIIEGNLNISGNDLLEVFDMVGLSLIGGGLEISNNSYLSGLYYGLVNLDTIMGDLTIKDNISLISLAGIDNIYSNYLQGLYINNNDLLTQCDVLSICQYLINANSTAEIFDNAVGCNSVEEVMDSCGIVGINFNVDNEGFNIHPNPFTNFTTLSYTLDKPSNTTISIYNHHGQLIEKIEQEQLKGEQRVQWNAEGLPSGMYYFRIQAGDQVGGGKMVKME